MTYRRPSTKRTIDPAAERQLRHLKQEMARLAVTHHLPFEFEDDDPPCGGSFELYRPS